MKTLIASAIIDLLLNAFIAYTLFYNARSGRWDLVVGVGAFLLLNQFDRLYRKES